MADVNNTFFRFDSVTPNAVVDWRQTMYISPIQRQYQCASCWAIAAVDSISMMWAINTNSLPAILSPQQVCDCGTKQCCQGGWPDWAFSYVLFNSGITSVDNYPYMANDSTVCLANSLTPTTAQAVLSRLTSFLAASFSHIAFFLPSPLFPPQITGWELVPPYSAQALMKAVSMQPVVAFLSGSAQDFQQYNSRGQLKIYDGLCTTDINHAVLVAGYNYTGSSLAGSYWILKNTWFNTWGDGGYMYLAMSPDVRGKCGIHAYVAFRVFNQPIFDGIAFSIPAMYPVYYPSGPQPVKMNNGPISRADDGNDGRWWMRAFTAAADACSGINPCGAGRCYTRAGMARCDCSAVAGMVEVTGVPTSKCVPRNPCSSRGQYNPCGSGTCVNPGDGTYSCQCPTGYAIGAASDGTQTCVGVAGGPASFLAYPTVPGDSCSSVAAAFGLTTAALTALNPFLNCSFAYLPPSLGDNCPNIWNAANLTESTFLAINPGIRCQAPYLQVGQKVCINSPLLASLLTASSTSFSLYTVQPNDSLALISSRFITRCTTSSVSPAAIAAANNILETSPLVANTQLIIPCDARVGILDCGCAQSLPVCGADYVTYPSYCDALCNYALPVIQDGVCTGCNAACTGRTGLAPAAGYGCTWSTCPYPNWKPLDSDCTVLQGDTPGKCCAVEQTVCENVCRATRDTLGGTTTQMQSNYDSCYSQCMCCARVPCSTSTCLAPSSSWSQSPRKCTYSSYKYWWNCTWFPPSNPLA
ncbi:unnamed protein product [Closterium sp. NIES-54]